MLWLGACAAILIEFLELGSKVLRKQTEPAGTHSNQEMLKKRYQCGQHCGYSVRSVACKLQCSNCGTVEGMEWELAKESIFPKSFKVC